jgi:hypothetical protein
MFINKPFQSTYNSSSYIFKDSIERVFEVFRNPIYLEKAYEKYGLQINPKNNPRDKFDTKGAVFDHYLKKSDSYCQLIVENSCNEENRKMLQIRSINVTPFNFTYRLKMCFYWCSIMNQTILFEEVLFLHNRQDYFTQELLKTYDAQKEIRCKAVESFLKEFTFKLNQCESVIIDREFEETSKSVLNMNKFIKLSPSMGDKVILSNMNCKVGSEILLFSEGEKSCLKVIRNEMMDDKVFFELELINHGKTRKMPKQILQFTLIRIAEDKTFLSFVHVFVDPIRFSTISKMETNKKKILFDLKKNLEKTKKHRSN